LNNESLIMDNEKINNLIISGQSVLQSSTS